MTENNDSKRVPRMGAKQTLVVRQTENDFQREVLRALGRLETSSQVPKTTPARDERLSGSGFDAKTIVALAAIALSVAGYVIQDARNSSRQDAQIETAQVRLTNLERIASTNTEARIRTEVQLGELRDGQTEIKRMIEAHDNGSKKLLAHKR